MFTLNCKGRLLVIDEPIVMGIVNTTPDSFFENSRKTNTDAVLQTVEQMLKDGAAIIDMGGQSTRPGSEQVGSATELQRVVPFIEAVSKRFPEAFISVDTYHAVVAQAAVEAGAVIVNDISGGMMDEQMLSTVATLKVPYVCMHMKGTPENMHQNPTYEDLTREVLDFFIHQTEQCRLAGIHDVIVDPGFGFGKNIAHNFELLNNLNAFQMLQKPILLGISRKSTIYKTLGVTANEALNGTTVLNTIGLLKGANILRVHDVKEATEAIKLVSQLQVSGC
ncbi:MAG: dihydropteroate synthase [Sphingobacteriia bacterium]|nr:dihydropteroate synthase [Sphingobacteriia bacterium]